jgi:hypothetical protein
MPKNIEEAYAVHRRIEYEQTGRRYNKPIQRTLAQKWRAAFVYWTKGATFDQAVCILLKSKLECVHGTRQDGMALYVHFLDGSVILLTADGRVYVGREKENASHAKIL